MRIAVIVPELGLGTGYSVVVENLLAGLARQHEVGLFSVFPRHSDRERSTQVPYPLEEYAAGETRPVERNLSRMSRYFGVDAERLTWLEQRVAAFDAKRIIGFNYNMVPFVGQMRSDVPKIVDVIDSQILYSLRELQNGHFGRGNLKHFLAAIMIGRENFPKFAATVTVSSADTESLQRYGNARNVLTVPNGVDHEWYAPNPAISRKEPPRVIFCGSLSFPPNVQAVEWFVSTCWTEIQRLQSNAEFLVIGKNPPADLGPRLEKYAGVRVVGFVDDVRRYILESAVSVAPMVSGTGIKNKILEAWALGTPVVATPLAVKGLFYERDVNILIGKSADEFAAATASLLADRQRREQIGAAGRAHVMRHYSWDTFRAKFNSIVEEPLKYRDRATD
ncbi:MAG TPA: glycosyltransferase family 4 protein [Acidobacteriaceae bacterium]